MPTHKHTQVKREKTNHHNDEHVSNDKHRDRKRHRTHRDDSDSEHDKEHRKHVRSSVASVSHRKIKQEPLDEFENQRESRHHYNVERRHRHEERQRAGEDNFARMPNTENVERETDNPNVKQEKERPNFETSGRLADESNTFRGIVVNYNEPPEARRPKKRWILFPFKGDDALPNIRIHRQSAYLLGRDRIVADIPTDHPSCSKQHAALQFRLVPFRRDDGTDGRCVRPYIIDLESANGTYVNNKRIEARCYMELREKDVIKFGYSSREYVLLHDKSDTSEVENDDGVG